MTDRPQNLTVDLVPVLSNSSPVRRLPCNLPSELRRLNLNSSMKITLAHCSRIQWICSLGKSQVCMTVLFRNLWLLSCDSAHPSGFIEMTLDSSHTNGKIAGFQHFLTDFNSSFVTVCFWDLANPPSRALNRFLLPSSFLPHVFDSFMLLNVFFSMKTSSLWDFDDFCDFGKVRFTILENITKLTSCFVTYQKGHYFATNPISKMMRKTSEIHSSKDSQNSEKQNLEKLRNYAKIKLVLNILSL